MPVIVVLSDCPPKLRGDMSKWFFEINTGVYVGNISTRVRENLWKRITDNIGHGHATMVYSASGEQHMDFRVHNAYWEPVDFEGIKLMRRPNQKILPKDQGRRTSFSDAAKYRMISAKAKNPDELSAFHAASYVVLDIETTGLEATKDEIIEIGAILIDRGKETGQMEKLVQCRSEIPTEITRLTGISRENLEQSGVSLKNAVEQLLDFAEDLPFVCHNASFEKSFLQEACRSLDMKMENRYIDTFKLAQLLLPDLENYKLSTLVNFFGFDSTTKHRALSDCKVTYGVYTKLIELAFPQSRNSEY